jgi:DNA-binding MarR family transcriptional regulator
MDEPGRTREPGALTDVEERAWRGLMALVALGLPELERTFRDHGLVHIEYVLLESLATEPDGLRLSDLAGCAKSSQSRLTHRMRKLTERGYVEQVPSTCDGRVSIARITPAGLRAVTELRPAYLRGVRSVLFDHLDRDQVAALADALETLAARLERQP